VAVNSVGDFVVTWHTGFQDGSLRGVFAHRYASTGLPQGGEFRVNTYTTSDQYFASVASDSTGNFVIAWQSDTQDGDGFGVFAQRYDDAGTPLGGEFRVNTFTTNRQFLASAASDPAGNFVVAWTSDSQDGSGFGVFAQRYNMILPVELQSFRVE
jgi:hypothetical protein